MEIFVAFALLSCVSGQFLFVSNTINGHYGGYHFEQHKSHRLLMVKDNANCYLVYTDNALETAISNGGAKRIEAEIVAQIKAGTGLSDATKNDIKYDFHDYLAAAQCTSRAIHKLDYKYLAASVSPAVTTATITVSKSQTNVATQTQTMTTDVATRAQTTPTGVATRTQTTPTGVATRAQTTPTGVATRAQTTSTGVATRAQTTQTMVTDGLQ